MLNLQCIAAVACNLSAAVLGGDRLELGLTGKLGHAWVLVYG